MQAVFVSSKYSRAIVANQTDQSNTSARQQEHDQSSDTLFLDRTTYQRAFSAKTPCYRKSIIHRLTIQGNGAESPAALEIDKFTNEVKHLRLLSLALSKCKISLLHVTDSLKLVNVSYSHYTIEQFKEQASRFNTVKELYYYQSTSTQMKEKKGNITLCEVLMSLLPELMSIRLSGIQTSADGIFNQLAQLEHLTRITIEESNLSTVSKGVFKKLTAGTLRELRLEKMNQISETLEQMETLGNMKKLRISDCKGLTQGIPVLGGLLRRSNKLTQLKLDRCDLSSVDWNLLDNLGNITRLVLKSCKLSHSMSSLSRLLCSSDQLVELYLSRNDFGDEELKLFDCPEQIQVLDLSKCRLTDESIIRINQILSNKHYIEYLSLDDNKFGDSILQLELPSSLKDLYIERCGHSRECVEELERANQTVYIRDHWW